MKKILFILIATILTSYCFSQKNQSEIAKSWKEGNYDWFQNKGSGSVIRLEQDGTVEIKIVKDDKGNVNKIIIDKDYYLPDAAKISSHTRYFAKVGGEYKLYFVGSNIVVFTSYANDTKVDLRAVIGKAKLKYSMVELIETDLSNGFELQKADREKYKSSESTRTIKDREIKDIEIVLINPSDVKLKTGTKLEFGTITTFTDGSKLTSQNLGGDQYKYDFKFAVIGLKSTFEKNHEFNTYLYSVKECEGLDDSHFIINVFNDETSELLKTEKFSVECNFSKLKSDASVRSWLDYDEINFAYFYSAQFIVSVEKITKEERIAGFGYVSSFSDKIKVYESKYSYQDTIAVRKGENWAFANKKGTLLTKFEFERIIPIKASDIFICKKSGKWGAVNGKFETVIPFQYDEMSDYFKNSVTLVKKGGKYGVLDTKGKIILPLVYEQMQMSEFGFCNVLKNGKYAYANNLGEFITKFEFDFADPFDPVRLYAVAGNFDRDGFAIVSLDGSIKWDDSPASESESIITEAKKSNEKTTKSVSTAVSSNNTSSSSSSKTTSTAESGFSGNFKIINDTGKEVHIFLKNGGSGWWPTGSSKTVTCAKGQIVYVSTTNKTSDKVEVLKVTEDLCGKTIKLSKYYK